MRAKSSSAALKYSRSLIQNSLQRTFSKISHVSARKLHTSNPQKSNLDNTILHDAVRVDDTRRTKEIIIQHGLETAALMSKTVNDSGHIPLDLISPSSSKKKEFHSILFPLMKKSNIKKLSERIRIDEIIKHEHKENSVLTSNLKIACALANATREAIKKSPSHPECNDNDEGINAEAWKKLIQNRLNYCTNKYENYAEKAFEMASSTISSEVGNCEEFSAVSVLLLTKLPKIIGVPYRFINGDHSFLVIGQDPKSHPLKIETWGKNAVICDSWLGRVFPTADFSQNLGTYKKVKLEGFPELNVVTTYNSNYHILAPLPLLFDFEKKHSKNNTSSLFKNSNHQTSNEIAKTNTNNKKDALCRNLR